MVKVGAVLVAAGSSSRVGGDVPKQFQILGTRPVFVVALDALIPLVTPETLDRFMFVTDDKDVDDLLALSADVASLALAGMFVLLASANIGGIGFNDLALTAHRSGRQVLHGFANTVSHEPCGAVGTETEHAPELVRANALLGSGHQVHRQPPLGQRDFGALKDGPDRGRELALAGVAIVQARTMRALHALDLRNRLLINVAAMWAGRSSSRTIWFCIHRARPSGVAELLAG